MLVIIFTWELQKFLLELTYFVDEVKPYFETLLSWGWGGGGGREFPVYKLSPHHAGKANM